MILKELQSEFGGAAVAAADGITQFTNVLGDLEIGRRRLW